MDGRFCFPFSAITMNDVGRVGGKTASLGEMVRELGARGVPVPPGFAVSADAYTAVLDQGSTRARLQDILAGVDVTDLADLARRGHEARQCVIEAGLPAGVAREIEQAYEALARDAHPTFSMAVRSSATAEDLPEASFAGVDRDSGMLSHLFDERDPAVMRMIGAAIDGARAHGRPIGLCGQAPSDDPQFAQFLVERGIDSISSSPDAALAVLEVVARVEGIASGTPAA